MRRLLALGFLVAAVVTLASGQAAAAPTCTITAVGKHTRDQTLAVKPSAGCPARGSLSGTLSFMQYPNLTGARPFTVTFGTRTAVLHLPRHFWLNAAWTASFQGAGTRFSITATPRRQVFGAGQVTIPGGFTARNGAVVSWAQTLKVTSSRIDVGAFRINVRLPGGRGTMLQVRQSRSFCARGRTCPFGAAASVETYFFPPNFTSANVRSSSSFFGGSGFTWLRETPTILLRDSATGRILGRSDFLAVIRTPG